MQVLYASMILNETPVVDCDHSVRQTWHNEMDIFEMLDDVQIGFARKRSGVLVLLQRIPTPIVLLAGVKMAIYYSYMDVDGY